MFSTVVTTVIVVFCYRTVERHGWVPIRNKITGWIAAKFPKVAKLAAYIQKPR